MNVKQLMPRSNLICFIVKHAYFIDRDPIYLRYAVLSRPQFSFTSTSEIHVFVNFYSAIEIGRDFVYGKKTTGTFK